MQASCAKTWPLPRWRAASPTGVCKSDGGAGYIREYKVERFFLCMCVYCACTKGRRRSSN